MERGYAFDSASTQRKLIEEGYLTKDGKPTRKATDSPAAVESLRYGIEDAVETLKSCRKSIRAVRERYDIPEDVLAETGEE